MEYNPNMRYYVYKITNVLNGKEYIGIHKSVNIATDDYFGSGRLIIRALKKYGRHAFCRTILAEFNTAKEAFDLERELVTENYVTLDTTYNVAIGGIGGVGNWKWTPERRAKQSIHSTNLAKSITHEERMRRGKKISSTLSGRTAVTHPYLKASALKIKQLHGQRLARLSSLRLKHLWQTEREKLLRAVQASASKNRGRTKENSEGRRQQALKISGDNNPMKRPDVLDQFVGKTKENCEWRARQATTIKETIANFSPEKRQEISKRISNGVSGKRNGMWGRFGELSPVSKYTDEQRAKCKQLFADGIPRKEIARLIGVNYQTVKIWLRS